VTLDSAKLAASYGFVRELFDVVDAYKHSQCLYVLAKLGVADVLANGPLGAGEIARATGTHPESMRRFMRAMTVMGYFEHDAESDTFATTLKGVCLRSDHPSNVRSRAMAALAPGYWKAWGELPHAIRTGETAFNQGNGTDLWGYFDVNAGDAELYDRAQTDRNTKNFIASVLPQADLARFSSITDVGGGEGQFLAAILREFPDAHGYLVDFPRVVRRAQEIFDAEGVSERATIVGGDFLEPIIPESEAYVVKLTFHQMNDADALTLLTNIRSSIKPNGRLIVIDVNGARHATTRSLEAKLSDINMFVVCGARQRAAEQFGELFAKAKFDLLKVSPTPENRLIVLEAAPV
jgi:hypothetical protein